ncbi:FeoA family protein [Thalassotalea euphylliae]|nr:FeoA family protein [Thalassotalea euphylliae]
MKLTQASIGARYRVINLPSLPEELVSILEYGLLVGSQLSVVAISPFKGPMAISLDGTMLSLPAELAAEIDVEGV